MTSLFATLLSMASKKKGKVYHDLSVTHFYGRWLTPRHIASHAFSCHLSPIVEHLGDPNVRFYMPVFDVTSYSQRRAVAVLTALVNWRAYFSDKLPDNINGITVVLSNNCRNASSTDDGFFTYEIRASKANNVGFGKR